MRPLSVVIAAAVLCTAPAVQAAPPVPSSGLVNDLLRDQSPAFTNWDVGGQFRARFEGKSGFAVPGAGASAVDFSQGTPDNDYWLFREKVHVGWKPLSWATFHGEARDSQSIGDDRQPSPDEDRIDLHQAWINLGNPTEVPLSAKVGRQEMAYGSERLVGAGDWSNIGRVFDAAKLRYETSDFWVDVFSGRVVLINDGEFNVVNDYDWFSGVYASTRTFVPKHELQLYFLARNTTPQSPTATTGSPQPGGPTARDIYTAGLRFQSLPGQFGGWDYDGEFAGQFGNCYETLLSQRSEQRAFAAHLAGGYTFKETPSTPRAGLEYNFSSGDSDPNDRTHGTFDNLFPTNHRFYGFMDFFSWQNLHDVRLTTSAQPRKALTVTADCHLFWLADTADYFYSASGAPRRTGGYGLQPGNDSFVGTELEFIATYRVSTFGVLQAGYGHFFRADYVKESLSASGSQDADWVYVQATLSF